MKFIHLSDLHLGKRVNGFSMLQDQEDILDKLLTAAEAEQPDAVLIAGDIYDKSVPSAEAVRLFDRFLTRLAELNFDGRGVAVCLISGNHDSPERLSFGGRLMERSGVYVSPVYNGTFTPVTLMDAFGPVHVYLLPFVKPVHVRAALPDPGQAGEIVTFTDAAAWAVSRMGIDPAARNVLLCHQFVTGAVTCDSESISVGGSDNVDVSVFQDFDYVALGHLHGPQSVGRETIRYCGSPLKYSFSEANQTKSVTIVELAQKGSVSVRTIPLTPIHDLRELRGTYQELTLRDNYEGTATEDYLRITLSDENDVPNAMEKLRVIYPNLMELRYDNRRTRSQATLKAMEQIELASPMSLFQQFYQMQNNQPMSEEQTAFVQKIMEEIWEDEQ